MSERPLSPHLQIYRLPITAWLSITHRITGIILTIGLLVLVALLMAAAEGSERYQPVQFWLQSLAGRLFVGVWLFALSLHLCHGTRHLIWDTGHGFDRLDLDRHARWELAASILLTIGLLTISNFSLA